MGPNEVMFGDADTYRKINGVRSDFFKGPWYEPSRVLPDQDSLFSMRDDDLRKELRAKLTPGVRIMLPSSLTSLASSLTFVLNSGF